MSFGFSVGDLIGAANLAQRLIQALRGSHDAGEDYRAAITELGYTQQAFFHVINLGSDKNLSRATFQSASCIVMGSIDIIQEFLDRTKKYDKRLGRFSAGPSGLAQGFRKVGWALFKAEDMKRLRATLHVKLTALGVLLAAANVDPDNTTTQYLSGRVDKPAPFHGTSRSNICSLPIAPQVPPRPREHEVVTQAHSNESGHIGSASEVQGALPTPDLALLPLLLPMSEDKMAPSKLHNTTPPISISTFTHEELKSLIIDPANRTARIMELCRLLQILVKLGGSRFSMNRQGSLEFVEHLARICDDVVDMPVAPVKFKDALGRKFSFPWGLCMTWKVWYLSRPHTTSQKKLTYAYTYRGLEELIKQAFRHIDIIGRHVHEGHYDLEGPDGKTILPQAWDRVIQPDWAITMHMWPMPEPPPQPASLPPTPLNYIYHPSPSKQTTATILLDSSSTPPRTPSPTPVNSASEEISMSGSKMHAPRGARPEFRRAFKPELYESETKKKESKHQRYGYPRVTEINDEGWESDAEANMKTVTKDRVTKVTE